ncbi:MocE family 2Fe-2S type ferredoxin [Flavimaricola marinus]|uniref:Naphthalene 1,2-dioxygenase system ferredoxin subunit n=1 Tax=Flavimaricola marinus TaxID=1819565 RepID=A0A238LJB4_9RHOB|nr:MocE family 2Fe-2S type ferredoxin [Flavimaricola marinus]SMY09769.1 Naphthalene 1,2-dioxygenase system ferredoxin subunit [Flavimaricola marinus]
MPDWIDACHVDDIETEEVIRFDHADRTYAIYHAPDDAFYCTSGLCTHEDVHLADGLVMDFEIECPKHSAVFDYRSGEVLSPPACINLKTYPTKIEDGRVWVNLR